MRWRFALSMARREARASATRLALFGACMGLGVAALVALHGVRNGAQLAIESRSRQIFGADLRLASRVPLAPRDAARVAELEAAAGTTAARVTRFGSMALAKPSERSRLVDVQAVEGRFPFYGEVRSEPAGLWSRLAEGERLALADPSLLVQLDAQVGDDLLLGGARFRIAGTVLRAPGSVGLRSQVAPRVFIARRHLAETGLIRPGSLVDHLVYLQAPDAAVEAWLAVHRSGLEASRVRIQTARGHQREVGRSFETIGRYLGLVGLAALALGGVGVASGVRVLVREKLESAAVLRALGAGAGELVAIYGLLAAGLGLLAGVAGAALGTALQWLLPGALAGLLPVALEARADPVAAAIGVATALWLCVLLSTGPLLQLARVAPLCALRRGFDAEPRTRAPQAVVALAIATSLLAAALWQAPGPGSGLAVAAGLGAGLGSLAAVAAGAAAAVRRLPLRRAPFWLRQGVSNLFRPRNHTLASTLAVGFGLFLVATLHAVQSNVLRQIELDVRPDRPNLVVFDVQSDQLAEVEQLLGERGAPVLERTPLVSARIAHLHGRPSVDWLAGDSLEREFRWALRREYRLTYTADLRPGERVVEGRWWSGPVERDAAPVPVSLERDLAESLAVAPGDRIGWEIQGVTLESVVASLREVDWSRLSTNFFAIFPPGVLERAPQSRVVLTRLASSDARARLQRDLVERFPNVSIVDATVVLEALEALAREMGTAVRALALLTLTTGLVVLCAAALAGRQERMREALLLRTLGASSHLVRRIAVVEAVALAALAVTTGSLLAVASAWAAMRWIFGLPFDPPWGDLCALAGATLAVSALLAGASGRAAARRGPLAALRHAERTGAGAG